LYLWLHAKFINYKGIKGEEDVPTQQRKEKKNLWVPVQDEHSGWKKHYKQKEEKGKKKACCLTITRALFNFTFSRC
jgi:hypothetical protein